MVIVGGGIAGLTAAWKLLRSGLDDFVVLDLDEEVGGNARSGRNAVSAYPWGAHYIPIPHADARAVIELFQDLGVIVGFDAKGLPIYDEQVLCAEPQERLLIRGVWQPGLRPRRGIEKEESDEIRRFLEVMHDWRARRGNDGKFAFAIPVDHSSRDPELLALDRLSMGEWMDREGWRSPHLRWYVNYCCRDDYGSTSEETSAWAGIHYFAARRGLAANAEANAVLTWPQGNGWVVQELARRLGSRARTNSVAFSVEADEAGVSIDCYDNARSSSVRFRAEAAVFAAPRFVAAHVVRALRESPPSYLSEMSYAPWLVANVTVDQLPGGRGAPLAWDNVSYSSPSLGYVVATHQNLRRYPSTSTVLTYYRPLSDTPPAEARRRALDRSVEDWRDLILDDLEGMHRGVTSTVRRIDVWLWGHGMIRPTPGFLWGEARRAATQPIGRLWFAHSDMSGISIFEEATYRGVSAAENVLATLGIPFVSSLGASA